MYHVKIWQFYFTNIIAKFVVLRCAFCKHRRDFVPSMILVKARYASHNQGNIDPRSPSSAENDSRLLNSSEGNRDGEWIF